MELVCNELWWKGPKFLIERRVTWPEWQITKNTAETTNLIESECKAKAPITQSVFLTYYDPEGRKKLIHRYSSFHRTCRISAYVVDFVKE